MSRKPMMHGCYDIHVKGEKRLPRYGRTQLPARPWEWQYADFTLCGVSANWSNWRRKQIKISERPCPRTVTCKRCVASINKYKRIRNNAK